MWRWSRIKIQHKVNGQVFSTYVEMILKGRQKRIRRKGILHVCGDDPNNPIIKWNGIEYSPRMWRWSYCLVCFLCSHSVFSTYVEMILNKTLSRLKLRCILHVCGDDPVFEDRINDFIKYSPRMWSCFWCPQVWRFCSALVLAKLLTRIIQ